MGSSLASVPSAATHFAPANGGSLATLSGVSMSGSVSTLGGHGGRAVSGNGSMSSTGLSSGVGGMRMQR